MTTSNHAHDDSIRPPKASALAKQGDTLRLAGNYAKATVVFTKALHAKDLSDSLRSWILAHLGASWLGLGNLELSVKNLQKALEQRPDYSWARAHKGEAWRQYTRNNIVALKEKKMLWACVCQAIVDLEAAARACPDSPWIMAHCGAAWGLAFYVAKNLPEVIIMDADP